MPREPRFPFSGSDLVTARHKLEEQFPEATSEFIGYALASEVILNVLGPDWCSEHVAGEEADSFLAPTTPLPLGD
jgi:hypothetical protein